MLALSLLMTIASAQVTAPDASSPFTGQPAAQAAATGITAGSAGLAMAQATVMVVPSPAPMTIPAPPDPKPVEDPAPTLPLTPALTPPPAPALPINSANAQPAQPKLPPAPEVVTYSGQHRPRVDVKKPYMRVWFWPPTPESSQEPTGISGTPSVSSNGTPGSIQVDPIHFATASSNVLNDKENQRHLAEWLRADSSRVVVLDGHADVRGSSNLNNQLARKRAESVKASLVRQGAIPSQIQVESHGKNKPLQGNTADESWWLSRRVEIRIVNAGGTTAALAKPVTN